MSSAPKARRVRLTKLALVALLLLPIIEIAVIVAVGEAIGGWPTFLLIVATSLLGAWLIRREGAKAWRALDQAVRSGRMPTREIADGIVVLVGGGLLLVPGFVTDVVGLVLVLPFVRPVARNLLAAVISRRLVTQTMTYTNLTVTEAPEWEQRGGARGPASLDVERRRRRGRDHRRGLNPAPTVGRGLRVLRDGIPNRQSGTAKSPPPRTGRAPCRGLWGRVRRSCADAASPRGTRAAASGAPRGAPRARGWNDARGACPSACAGA